MTDASPDRTPRSAQLPGNAPKATKRIVKTLADLAGPASSARLASRLGVQLTGRVATELASAKQYGFIAAEGDKLIVTERGETFIGEDEEAALEAARDAVMSTGFAPIVKKLMTRQADTSIVAVRFEEDRALNSGPAKSRAAVLVKAAEETKLISDGRFDAGPIEDTIVRVGEVASEEAPLKSRSVQRPATTRRERAVVVDAKPSRLEDETRKRDLKQREGSAPLVVAPSMQIVLQIDASKLSADEILAIAAKLKEVGGSTASS